MQFHFLKATAARCHLSRQRVHSGMTKAHHSIMNTHKADLIAIFKSVTTEATHDRGGMARLKFTYHVHVLQHVIIKIKLIRVLMCFL